MTTTQNTRSPNTRWQIRVPTATNPQGEVISWTSPTQPTEEDIADILEEVGIDHSPGTPLPKLQTGYSGAPGRLPVSPEDRGMTPSVPTGIGHDFSEFLSAMGSDAPLPPVDELKSGWIRGGYPYAELIKGITELGKGIYRDPNAAVGDAIKSLVMPNAERFNLGKEQVQSLNSVIPGVLNMAGGVPLVGPIFGRAANMASDIGQGRILEAGMQAPLLAADWLAGRYVATKAATTGQRVANAIKARQPAGTPPVPRSRGTRWSPTPTPNAAPGPATAAPPAPVVASNSARRQQLRQAIMEPAPRRVPAAPPPVVATPPPVVDALAQPVATPSPVRRRAAKRVLGQSKGYPINEAVPALPTSGRIGTDLQGSIKQLLDDFEETIPGSSPDVPPVQLPAPVAVADTPPPPKATSAKASPVPDDTIVTTSTGESVNLATLNSKQLNQLFNAAPEGYTSLAYLVKEGEGKLTGFSRIMNKLKKELANPRITQSRYKEVEETMAVYARLYESAQTVDAHMKGLASAAPTPSGKGALSPETPTPRIRTGGQTVIDITNQLEQVNGWRTQTTVGMGTTTPFTPGEVLAMRKQVEKILSDPITLRNRLEKSLDNGSITKDEYSNAVTQLKSTRRVAESILKDLDARQGR